MRKLIWQAALALLAVNANAQEQEYRRCYTDEMHEQMLLKDPEYGLRRALIQNAARIFMAEGLQKKKESSKASIQFIVPVVFHIIHNYGPENISKEQVLDAVRLINESFQKKSADTSDVIAAFQPIFANCEIEFRLAQIDPNGNCHDGITRTKSEQTYSADDGVKSLVNWPSNKYLNIWVVNNIASGAAGYAYYPGANPQIDGIVIRHDYCASIGTAPGTTYNSRALSHEIGHYLDLPHTWGSTNQPGVASNCNIDDGIFDTPNTLGISNFSCNTAQSTCGSLDNVQNYMDYGSCPKMFTEGQKDRMHTTLYGPRDYLVSVANNVDTGTDDGFIAPPCAPIADFSDRKKFVCANVPVQFKDLSWRGTPDTWTWSFPGAVPAVSNDTNPVVVYPNPGIYDVTLTVSNVDGSTTLLRSNHVVVTSNPANFTVPYSEGFENMSTFPGSGSDWIVNNTPGTNPWALTSLASFSGTNSVYINNFVNTPTGTVDEFITPSFDLSNVTNASLTFQLAFARKLSASVDSLKVYASKDCGATWTLRYNKSGTSLITNTSLFPTQAFFPQAADWRMETVSIASPTYNNQPNIKFLFRYYQSAGNNIFIDDLNLTGTVSINEAYAGRLNLQLYPNPSGDFFYLSFELQKSSTVKIDLMDLSGKQLRVIASGTMEASEHLVRVEKPLAAGMYLIKITTEEGTAYKRVVITE
jgi:PKD repeat protein